MFSGLQSRKPDVTLDVAVNIRPRLRWFPTQNITFTICAHQTSTLRDGDESPGGQAGDCSLNSAIFLCDQSCRCSTRRRWRHEDNGISGLNVFFSVQTATRLLYHEWWMMAITTNYKSQSAAFARLRVDMCDRRRAEAENIRKKTPAHWPTTFQSYMTRGEAVLSQVVDLHGPSHMWWFSFKCTLEQVITCSEFNFMYETWGLIWAKSRFVTRSLH